MIFGNWNVTNDAITWNGGPLQRFVIPAKQLNKIRNDDAGGTGLYDWILLATEEDWLEQDDLYDLNFAFVYAIARAGLDFNYEVFDATLEVQYEQFDIEEDEDDL